MLRYSTIIIILIKFQTTIEYDKIITTSRFTGSPLLLITLTILFCISLIRFCRILSLSYLIPPEELEISKKRYSYETQAAAE